MENQNTLSWQEVPAKYALCFNSECEQCETCLHYLAGKAMPDEKYSGIAIFPTAWAGGTCRAYQEARRVQMACGLYHLMSLVRHADMKNIHKDLYDLLGNHMTFYRCNKGKYMLSEEQQEAVLSLFHKYGYTDDLHFDSYRTVWHFK